MGQLKRQLVLWGAIATTTAVLPGLALAENISPEHKGGRHGRGHHHHDDAKLAVAGRALSKGSSDSYGLQIRGRTKDEPSDAHGRIRFAHRTDNVMEGLVGRITCLSKNDGGVVSVTGTIVRSGKRERGKDSRAAGAGLDDQALLDEIAPWSDRDTVEPADHRRGRRGDGHRRGRGELAGKDFALTIKADGKPQAFTVPTVADKGTVKACSGGSGTEVEVTRGGFRVREADAKASDGKSDDKKDSKKDGDKKRKRRGLFG